MENMTPGQKEEARAAWAQAAKKESLRVEADADVGAGVDEIEIRSAIYNYMHKELRWTEKELHDALVTAGIPAPQEPTLLEYHKVLHDCFGDSKKAFCPQNQRTHSKSRMEQILKILSRTSTNLGGTKGTKKVLSERLAKVLDTVIEAGRRVLTTAPGNDGADNDSENELRDRPLQHPKLFPRATTYGDLPDDAVVDAEQAESALGHVLATELDDFDTETVDKDLRAEEEALIGRVVNPDGMDYTCLTTEKDLTTLDFQITREDITSRLNNALEKQREILVSSTTDAVAQAKMTNNRDARSYAS
jgi:hypothetical protein